VTPDVMSVAKGIGGGFPMGAVLATEAVARHLTAGSHGTTFGGSPLACAAGNAVLDIILAPGFLDEVNDTAARLWAGLQELVAFYPDIFAEARGQGLLVGLKCLVPNTDMQAASVAEGLLTVAAGDNVLRLAPPLIVRAAEVDVALEMLAHAATRIRAHLAAAAQ